MAYLEKRAALWGACGCNIVNRERYKRVPVGGKRSTLKRLREGERPITTVRPPAMAKGTGKEGDSLQRKRNLRTSGNGLIS